MNVGNAMKTEEGYSTRESSFFISSMILSRRTTSVVACKPKSHSNHTLRWLGLNFPKVINVSLFNILTMNVNAMTELLIPPQGYFKIKTFQWILS